MVVIRQMKNKESRVGKLISIEQDSEFLVNGYIRYKHLIRKYNLKVNFFDDGDFNIIILYDMTKKCFICPEESSYQFDGGYGQNPLTVYRSVGKYVALKLEPTSNNGFQVVGIKSLNVIADVNNAFRFKMNRAIFCKYFGYILYDFLVSLGRRVELNGSIKLKGSYQDFYICKLENGDCFFKEKCITSTEVLNYSNLQIIYSAFYEGRRTGGSLDDVTEYAIRDNKIVEIGHKSHKYTGENLGRINIDIIKIGSRLSENQSQFLKQYFKVV